jgi:hypothetical protein
MTIRQWHHKKNSSTPRATIHQPPSYGDFFF